MKRYYLFLFVFLLPIFIKAQTNNTENEQKFKLSGYVKNDFFWDSRQTVAAREGSFLLWPSAVLKDANGKDINAVPNFNFLSLQSRLSFSWSGTEAFGAKISALIQGDFFAQANDNINLFRLRHALIKMKWENTTLLMGQYWIPMFTPNCYPGTVSFNTGTPINPFGRNPQIRLIYHLSNINLIAIASSQRDYSSRGPSGTTGSYLRNSTIPELTTQIQFKTDNIVAGVSGSFKQIVPQLVTDKGIATNTKLPSVNALAFIKIKSSAVTIKAKAIYGQNIPDVLSIGGFAVTAYNTTTGEQEYEPISTLSYWGEINTNNKKMQVGLFAGYTQNMGTKSDIVGAIYGLATNISTLYRVSPRLILNSGKFRFAVEPEYTVANYATAVDTKNLATTTEAASNLRLLLACYYFF